MAEKKDIVLSYSEMHEALWNFMHYNPETSSDDEKDFLGAAKCGAFVIVPVQEYLDHMEQHFKESYASWQPEA